MTDNNHPQTIDITEIWKQHFVNNGCLTVTLLRPDIKKAIEDSMWDYSRKYARLKELEEKLKSKL